MSKFLNARPNRNGNTRSHFRQAFVDLEAAKQAMEQAIRTLSMNVVHGRNYQTVENADAARKTDLAKVQKLSDALSDINDLQAGLIEAILEVEE